MSDERGADEGGWVQIVGQREIEKIEGWNSTDDFRSLNAVYYASSQP